MEISLIIPIYNVQKYLKKCLNSCLTQDIPYEEFEIIAVNDGSTDDSEQILSEYSDKYSNIKVLHQKNQGLSIARNNGLKVAKGDYVWFVDSDDWIENNCLQDVINTIKTKPDILQIQYRHVFENSQYEEVLKVCWEDMITGKELTIRGGLPEPAQFAIYNRQFLIDNNLFFYPKIYHEDCDFKYRCIWSAKKCQSYPKVIYNYLQRNSGSISKNFKIKNGEDYLFVINRMIDFMETNRITGKYRSALCFKMAVYLNMIYKGCASLNKEGQNKLLKLLTKNKHIFKYISKSTSIKHQVEAHILWINPTLFGRMMIRSYK